MKQIIPKRTIWFSLSSLLVVGAIIVIATVGLRFGIDFTGGSLMEFTVAEGTQTSAEEIEKYVSDVIPEGEETRVQASGDTAFLVRTAALTEAQHQDLIVTFNARLDQEIEELRFESIGPVLGEELKRKALTALVTAIVIIILYIAWSFRKVSQSVQSWKYGVGAIVALAHDVVIVTGLYALAGLYLDVRVDALFVTALLVILGYSVNDTIVVYDRIRENVLKDVTENTNQPFETIVNTSVNETLTRSVNTSLTTLIVLFALFFFGGASISGFVLALILGVLVGTYSSIFLASPLLVGWERLSARKAE